MSVPLELKELRRPPGQNRRDELALAMLAAWVGVSRAALPDHPSFKFFPNSHAETAWGRVATAAREYLAAQQQEDGDG